MQRLVRNKGKHQNKQTSCFHSSPSSSSPCSYLLISLLWLLLVFSSGRLTSMFLLKRISVESRVFAFLLRCVGEHGRRSRRLSGRPGRSGFGPKRAGETRRRESEGDEQEAAAHVGGAAHQEHAPAEGNGPHQHATWTVSTGWGFSSIKYPLNYRFKHTQGGWFSSSPTWLFRPITAERTAWKFHRWLNNVFSDWLRLIEVFPQVVLLIFNLLIHQFAAFIFVQEIFTDLITEND